MDDVEPDADTETRFLSRVRADSRQLDSKSDKEAVRKYLDVEIISYLTPQEVVQYCFLMTSISFSYGITDFDVSNFKWIVSPRFERTSKLSRDGIWVYVVGIYVIGVVLLAVILHLSGSNLRFQRSQMYRRNLLLALFLSCVLLAVFPTL